MRRNKGVKTKVESLQYKRDVRAMPGYKSTVDGEPFSSLQGSNEDYYQESSPASQEKSKGLKRARLKKFLKEHVFEEIVSVVLTIVVAFSGWMINNIITIREKTAAYEVRIEVAQDKLEQIEGDFVTREYLTQELEILKLKIENAHKDDLSSIEAQIVSIEKEIKYISEKLD